LFGDALFVGSGFGRGVLRNLAIIFDYDFNHS